MSGSATFIPAITGDIRANTHTPSTQWDPSVTALEGGKFVAVWTSFNQEGVDTSVFAQHRGGVYGQIFNADGTKSGAEFLVNTIILGDQNSPNVAALSGGGFVVSFSSNPGFGNEYDVRARVYNGNGSAVGAEFELTSSSALQSNVTIAARPGGGFVATWLEANGTSGNFLKARAYDNSGTPIGSQANINRGSGEVDSAPGITALQNGDYIVTWMRGPNDGSGSADIMAARFDVNGNAVTAPFVVNDNAASTQGWMPQAAQLTDGRTVIAWSDGGIFSSDVRFKIFNLDGSVSQAETVVTPANTVERAADIIALADGGFLVTYESTASGNGQIMAQRYLASGAKLGDAVVINQVDRGPDQQVSYNQTVPGRIDYFFGTPAQTVSQLEGGDLVVVWQGTDPSSPSNGIDIYTRVLDLPAYTVPSVTSPATASFAENGTGIAYQATATDADGQAITWSLTGTDAARFTIDAAGAVRFVASPNFEAPTDTGANNVYDINVVASDGVTSTPRAVAISVTDVVEAPALSGFGPAVTFLENAVNAAPALLDADVVFTALGALAGGRLVVSGLLAEHRVSVLNQGDAAGQIGVSGNTISFGGTVIGTASGGVGGDFTVTFAAGATAPAVDALIQRLAYANVSDTPTATRTLSIDVIDGAGVGLPTGGVEGLTPLSGSANPFNGMDVGFSAVPAFFDLDGDGDRDLVVGESGGTILSWRNTGTDAAPVFTALTGAANPFNGIDVGLNATPSFVDLNGDGRLDLVSGVNTGAFQAWQNTGTNAAPVFTPLTGAQNPFDGFIVGNWSQVSFTDLDGDGDPDLVAGEGNGAILAWRNIGTATAPSFQALSGVSNPFNGIDVGLFSRPAFVDLDGDGDLDLVSGEQQGALLAWRNTGTNAAPVYTQLTGAANPFNGLDAGQLSTPVFVDIDGDRDLDLVSGNFDGQVVAWRNNAVSLASITVTVTPEDDVAATTLAIAARAADRAEGNGAGTTPYTFTVTRSGDTTGASSATWAVSGAAVTAADFAGGALPTGTVRFAAGETSQTVTVNVARDSLAEIDEVFSVTLSAPSAGTGITTATASGTIRNDDVNLAIAALSADKAEGDSGTTSYTFAVTRSGDTSGVTTAQWRVTGSAGAVADDFVGAALPKGNVRFAAGETEKIITVRVAGDTLVEGDNIFTVTLSKPSGGATITTPRATGTIRNDDTALSIAATSADKAEGDDGTTPFTFTVTRTGDTSGTDSATWAVSGADIAAADFTGGVLPTGTVSFAAGETTKTITINVAGDTVVEGDEAFTVTLSAPSAGTTITTAAASGTIRNDDTSLSIAARSADRAEGNGTATTPFTFTVTRAGDTTGASTATWAVSGADVNAADFAGGVLPTGTVSFAAGERSQTITVQVAQDRLLESDETFTVTLSAPSIGTTIATTSATGTIRNDDTQPTSLAIAAASADKAEGILFTVTPFSFTVTRSGPTTGTSTANWVVGGGANAADFVGGVRPSGTVSFAAGETTKTISFAVLGDLTVEANETFTVTLSAPSEGTIITTATATGTIRNDDFEGTEGADTMISGVGEFTGGAPNEWLDGLAGNDLVSGLGGNDGLSGGDGADTLLGGDGIDVLLGGAGADRLEGGEGADTLAGGGGGDTLIGGTGADVFLFERATDSSTALAGRDRILGFSVAEGDRIDVSAIDANTALEGDQAFVLIADEFSGTPGEMLILALATSRRIEFDVDGDGASDFAITVAGTPTLTADSFIL